MRKLTVTLGALVLLACVVGPAMARPQYCGAFFRTYQLNPGAGVFQGKACLVCHVDNANKPRGWTQYGKDFAVALGDVTDCKDDAVIVAALKKIEQKTSSVTKTKYIDTIRKGEFPAGNPQ